MGEVNDGAALPSLSPPTAEKARYDAWALGW